MTRSLTALGTFGAGLVVAAFVAAPLSGELNAQSPQPKAQSGGAAKARKEWTPPRTPWGDPDISGNYTNKYEQSTPFERPPEFAGRRVEEVTSAELADVLEKRRRQVVERPAGIGPLQFRDILDVTRGSRAWFVVDPPDGKIPPMTPEAQHRTATNLRTEVTERPRPQTGTSFGDGPFDGPEDLDLWDRCITRGLPGSMLPHIIGNSYQIVQGPGFVGIRYELIHEARLIPLDGRPHVGKGIRLEMGDARGHWEGNTLVIETTNFKDRSAYRNANAATLRLVERFTRTAPDRIEWAVTVDDPKTWTRPWTFAMPLTMTDREPILEFACHEGNYAVPHILSAARATEKAADQAPKKP